LRAKLVTLEVMNEVGRNMARMGVLPDAQFVVEMLGLAAAKMGIRGTVTVIDTERVTIVGDRSGRSQI
jgi:hypothetical protein